MAGNKPVPETEAAVSRLKHLENKKGLGDGLGGHHEPALGAPEFVDPYTIRNRNVTGSSAQRDPCSARHL
jgi:hypothetical protein